MAPSEFWRLSPTYLFWFVESKIPEKENAKVFDEKWHALAAKLD